MSIVSIVNIASIVSSIGMVRIVSIASLDSTIIVPVTSIVIIINNGNSIYYCKGVVRG